MDSQQRLGVENAIAAIDLLSDRWTLLVMFFLKDETMRFGELERAIGRISPKMLTQTLRRMERNGLVQRHVYAEVPPRVEYSPTELGTTLAGPLMALCDWSV
ncbi:MAG: helix-turn-helix domain-containing protein, partial [Chloroflexota bacterium]